MPSFAIRALRRVSLSLPLAALAIAWTAPAKAQDAYPTRPVRFIIPYAAGGTGDILARLIGNKLGALYGQQFIMDNRPGAGGNLGADLAAKAPADGHTLFLGAIGIHAGYAAYNKLAYDPVKDVLAITVIAEYPNVVIAHPSLPVKTLGELAAYARANPGKVNFGSGGVGASTHLAGELFKMVAGVDLTHVPYRGSAPALNDLIAGQIQLMFENLPTTPPLIKAGQVKGLATTDSKRAAMLPDVPTSEESGVPGYIATAWLTLSASSATPRPILQKLNTDVSQILKAPEVVAQLAELGATPVGEPLDKTAAFMKAEAEKWTAVINKAGIKLD